MSDPKVENIRRANRQGIAVTIEATRYLLTKLDEAEQERDAAYLLGMASVSRKLEAAEERERALIAGVKEALAFHREERGRDQYGSYSICNGDRQTWPCRTQVILSRLLPSTPTEEGKK